jgi:hypothetical protein
MFDEMYAHVGKEEERLNASTYHQARRCTYGVVHTEIFKVGGCYVANLYQYPINNRITKSMCVPMPKYTYDFSKIVWERTRYFMPSAARDIPPIIAHSISSIANLGGGGQQAQGCERKKGWYFTVPAWYANCVSNI